MCLLLQVTYYQVVAWFTWLVCRVPLPHCLHPIASSVLPLTRACVTAEQTCVSHSKSVSLRLKSGLLPSRVVAQVSAHRCSLFLRFLCPVYSMSYVLYLMCNTLPSLPPWYQQNNNTNIDCGVYHINHYQLMLLLQ